MLGKLHASQRFWLMFATVFFASAIAVIAVAWPKRDAALVADLQAAECAEWRELPDEMPLEIYPNPDDKCFALRRFLIEKKTHIHTVDQYDSYLAGQRARTVFRILGWWAGFCAGLYALGFASVRLHRKLRPADGPKSA